MKSVREVSMIRRDEDGGVSRTVLYKGEKRKKKKQTMGLKTLERMAHEAARAEDAFASSYLSRHEGSNEKKRDGWIRDLNKNLYKASKTAGKKVKVNRLLGL